MKRFWNGGLGDLAVEFEKKATVVKYLVPEGYPVNPRKGERIEVGGDTEGVKSLLRVCESKKKTGFICPAHALWLLLALALL